MQEPVFQHPLFHGVWQKAYSLLKGSHTRARKLFDLCRLLNQEVPHYDWAGFYWASAAEPHLLELGEYEGEPTEHTRIPFGRGICGQVAISGKMLVVPDVSAQINYLACSLTTKAEIVAPIRVHGKVVGQLDIDSNTLNPFTPDDVMLLNALCGLVGQLLENKQQH